MHVLSRRKIQSGVSLPALILLLGIPLSASAEAEADPDNGNWSFKVGAGAYSAPDYSGSDELESFIFPSIDVTYKDIFFASVLDGIGFNFLRRDNWGATLSGQIVMGREAEGDIEELEPIDDRLMPKLEVFADTGGVRLHAAVIGDGKRHSGEAGLQYLRQASERSVYMLGGGARWNDREWNDERFSLDVGEAASIGVQPYSAAGSLSEGYIEGAFIYYLSPVYVLEMALEVAELTGDPADSPIVSELGTTTQPSMFIRINRQL